MITSQGIFVWYRKFILYKFLYCIHAIKSRRRIFFSDKYSKVRKISCLSADFERQRGLPAKFMSINEKIYRNMLTFCT